MAGVGPDQPVRGVFRIGRSFVRLSQRNDPYRIVELVDSSGALRCYGWTAPFVHAAPIPEWSLVEVEFRSYQYQQGVAGRLTGDRSRLRDRGRTSFRLAPDTGRSVQARRLAVSANCGRSGSHRKIFLSGRLRQHAEVTVAVDARRQHPRDHWAEQIARRQELWATAAGARFPVVTDGDEVSRSSSRGRYAAVQEPPVLVSGASAAGYCLRTFGSRRPGAARSPRRHGPVGGRIRRRQVAVEWCLPVPFMRVVRTAAAFAVALGADARVREIGAGCRAAWRVPEFGRRDADSSAPVWTLAIRAREVRRNRFLGQIVGLDQHQH